MHGLLPFVPYYINSNLESLWYFLPEIYLSLLFLLVMVTDLIFGAKSKMLCKIVACAGLLLVINKDLQQLPLLNAGLQFNGHFIFNQMLLLNHTAIDIKVIIDCLAFILILYFDWDNSLAAHPKGLSDLYSIVIASVFGLHLMTMACNLLSTYLSIEMVSIASYLMVAYRTESSFSAEAGLKYVLFGAAASAVMLYGISLLYSLTGSLGLYGSNLLPNLIHGNALSISFALILVLVGIGFKLSFLPMHFWVPDVYEGAPTPVTAYLSTLPKIAGFALLAVFLKAFVFFPGWNSFNFRLFFEVVGIITMIVGNFAAVLQHNVKRMLAYSSIGHTGFALMGIVTFNQQGMMALSYYLAVYAIANIGALALVSYFENVTGAHTVDDYKGFGLKYPVASVCFVVILVSLTGLPITAGFTGKVFLFSAVYAVYAQTHDVWLMAMMVTGALTTVVSLFYYFKVPLNLFVRKQDIVPEPRNKSYNLLGLSILISIAVVLLGIFPDLIYKYL